MKLLYTKQRLDKQCNELTEQSHYLSHAIGKLKNHSDLKEYALKMGMKPLRLNSVKRVDISG